ncbi:CARDB domain-containing protein [Natrialbaceae archaeon A-CW2]
MFVCLLAVGALTVGLAGPTLAADQSLECADGSGGGPVYVTDSGLEVTDNATGADEAYPTFPDNETVSLEGADIANVSFVAAGAAELRLEERDNDRTCVAAVNASANDVLIDPADTPGMTINGSLEALSFGDIDFEVDDVADLAYEANESVTFTIHDTGLEEGDPISIESLDSDAIDEEVDASSNGTLVITLPAGDHRLSLSTASSDDDSSSPPPAPPAPPSPPDDDDPAAFELSELALEPSEIEVGEETTVSATVTNVGDETGSYEVKLLVDGEEVDNESVSLAGGSSETVVFDAALYHPGTVPISLDDESVGTVTVTEVESGSDDDADEADSGADDDSSGTDSGADDDSGDTDSGSDDAEAPGADDDSGGTDAGVDDAEGSEADDGEQTPDPESTIDEESGTPWLLISIGLVATVAAGVAVVYSQGYLDPYIPE